MGTEKLDVKDVGILWISPDLRPLAVSTDSLTEDPENLRDHGGPDDEDMTALMLSISEFGQQKPIVVGPNGVSAAGSGFLMAAKLLGKTHIARVTYDADKETLQRFGFMDNRTAEMSRWNVSRLKSRLNDDGMKNLMERVGMLKLPEMQVGLRQAGNVAPFAENDAPGDENDAEDSENDAEDGDGDDENDEIVESTTSEAVQVDDGSVHIKWENHDQLKPIYPYYGTKVKVAPEIWRRLGDVSTYIEPFYGSGAVHLARPNPSGFEIVNDIDALIANFWRGVKHDPLAVANAASDISCEVDMHARELSILARLDALKDDLTLDPDYFDARIAGWWVWGMTNYIGFGFCSGEGNVGIVDGRLVRGVESNGIYIKRTHIGARCGIDSRKVVGDVPIAAGANEISFDRLLDYMKRLQDRYRNVRVLCGPYDRMLNIAALESSRSGMIGVFLDPPYLGTTTRAKRVYRKDDLNIASSVREVALEMGANPRFRVALCGYAGEHEMPGWSVVRWTSKCLSNKKQGNINTKQERIWFSPHCLKSDGINRNFDEDHS